jgi:hypothetical protein
MRLRFAGRVYGTSPQTLPHLSDQAYLPTLQHPQVPNSTVCYILQHAPRMSHSSNRTGDGNPDEAVLDVMLQTHSSPAAEGRSPPPVRCSEAKKSSYRHILDVTCAA